MPPDMGMSMDEQGVTPYFDDEDQPFGRRLARMTGDPAADDAGGIQPQPPTAGPVAYGQPAPAAGDDQPSTLDYSAIQPSGIGRILARQANPPPPPVGQDLPQAQGDVARYSQPINPRDDSGKMRPEYRMGTGTRVLGTLGNFLSGFGGSHREPTYVGPGATNSRFAQDESVRTGNLAGAQKRFKTAQDLAEENRKQYQTVTGAEQAADVKQQLADQKSSTNLYATRQGELKQLETMGVKLDPEERKFYMVNGKLREPNPDAEARLADIRQRQRERGDDRNAANLSGVQKDAATATTKHKAAIQKRIDQVAIEETPGTPAYKDKMAKIERDDYKGMAQIGNDFAGRSARYGEKFTPPPSEPWEPSNLAPAELARILGGGPPAAPAAQPIAPAAAPGQPAARPQPDPATAPAKPAAPANEPRVRVKRLSDGKVGNIPTSQLQQALASKQYQQVQ